MKKIVIQFGFALVAVIGAIVLTGCPVNPGTKSTTSTTSDTSSPGGGPSRIKPAISDTSSPGGGPSKLKLQKVDSSTRKGNAK
ncbi:hypothetical protein [Limnovirga soli]|uniref:Uncharacterized protein n=1 Tax=Limnovirga soli TaxID=2656915 RepID=A0A8J8FA28_9BACT|nr:hypothetical protein [Limnovirga soli]NNV53935.1 hypothetical protein [Limnovirga soli]